MTEVAATVNRQFAFNAPDGRVHDVWCSPRFGSERPTGKTRGVITVRLVQREDDGAFQPVSGETTVTSLQQPFRLQPPTRVLVYGRPVYAELTYSAVDGTLPLMWRGIASFEFTAHLV